MDPRHPHNGHVYQHLAPNQERQHQRFSWQTAVPEEEAPPYEPPQRPLPQTETGPTSHNRGFSYAQTPIELRDPYHSSTLSHPPLPFVQANAPVNPPDTRPTLPPSSASHHDNGYAAPFSPDSIPTHTRADPQTNHARKLSHLSPLDTSLRQNTAPPVPMIPQAHHHQPEADPLPYKAPISPISSGPIIHDRTHPHQQNNRKSIPAEPYSPHGFPTTPSHAVFSPHAAHGPNGLDFALHQPGQIAHPNMSIAQTGSRSSPHDFKHPLCECTGDIGTCLTGLFCPCILYGRTSYRLSRKSDKKDPTDMLGYEAVNAHCLLMGAACGLWWLFPMLQRTRIRHLYKVKGGLGGDLLKGCCCCCCVTIQNEREVRSREESARRWAGPVSTEVYTAPGQMKYAPQN